jgi:hypothetical protein
VTPNGMKKANGYLKFRDKVTATAARRRASEQT